MSLSRIFTLLYKDIKENYIVVLIMLIVPLIAFVVPQLKEQNDFRVSVIYSEIDSERYIEALEASGFEITESDFELALDSLNQKETDAVIDISTMTVKTYSKDMEFLSRLKNSLNIEKESIQFVNSDVINKSYHTFICLILFALVSIIACPIVFLTDKKDGLYNYLMITPLSYLDYVVSKIIFSTISMIFSVVFYLTVICQYNISIGKLLVVSAVLAIFAALISALISMFSESVDAYILWAFPSLLIVIIVLTVVYSSFSLQKFFLFNIIYQLLLDNNIEWFSLGLLTMIIVLLSSLFLYLQRKRYIS